VGHVIAAAGGCFHSACIDRTGAIYCWVRHILKIENRCPEIGFMPLFSLILFWIAAVSPIHVTYDSHNVLSSLILDIVVSVLCRGAAQD
jgi:hypothetical protein